MAATTTTSVLRGESHPQRLKDFISIHRFLDRMLESQAGASEKEALRQCADGVSINFGTLQLRANQLAARLSRRIVWPESVDSDRIVAVCLPPSIDLIVGLLAIFKLGAAYLPIDVTFPPDRVAHIISDAQPAILLSSSSILLNSNVLSKTENLPIFDIDQAEDDGGEIEDFQPNPIEMPDLLAAVLYTSGSTGIPKGVRLEHRTILHRLNWQWRVFPYDDEEGPACFKTALTFVDSIAEIWAPLLMTVPLLIVPKDITTNTESFISLLDRLQVSRLVLVPSLLKAMLSLIRSRSQLQSKDAKNTEPDSGALLSRLKIWVCSGEILTADLLLEFYDCFPAGTTICNYYGSTEVMGDVTYCVFESRQEVLDALVDNKVPIGVPLDNCRIYLLDSETQQLVGEGDVGEIYVAGSHICSGYVNHREMQRFVINPVENQHQTFKIMFRTGDFGRIVRGQLYYEGRSDSQIKVRGHRIDLNEVNLVVSRLDGVSACVVLCYKAGEPEQEMVAFIIPNKGTTIEDIKQKLKEKLVSYMIPKLVEISELPLLVNGKIDRQSLLRMFEDQEQTAKSISLCNEILLSLEEKALLKTVMSVVGGGVGRAVELSDNFFEIGGNSLNAVAVVTKLRDQGFNLDMATFLLSERLEELVPHLHKQSSCHAPTCDVYSIEMLSDGIKSDVIKMICTSFSEKAELELLTGVIYQDYDEFMNELWEPLVAANLSLVVKDKSGAVVGVALNFDVFDEPVVEPKVKRLSYVFEFLESIEAPIREQHFEKKKNYLIHSFMMATLATATAAENVLLIQKMEKETLELARNRGFSGVFTTNTNELTRQICDDLLDYKVLSEFQVRQFVASDGTKPFSKAPETQYSAVTVKFLT